jgi:NAD(P)-dependent dehydrogenase (short-subunit alcohol dehydrogenase family)
MMGFTAPVRALIVGARGGVGAAFVRALKADSGTHEVWATSTSGGFDESGADYTSQVDLTDETSLASLAGRMAEENFTPNLVLNCSGILHTDSFGPERTWRHLDIEVMRAVFDVNTFGVALLAKHIMPTVPRQGRSVFASLSARVGSIGDNRSGGWYSYRASKAAQNMILKGVAIEASMRWRELICVALHPGTVATDLSKPFARSVPPEKLFTPDQSCAYLSQVIAGLGSEQSGGFYAWDGQAIEY